jgi:hypothetical protein
MENVACVYYIPYYVVRMIRRRGYIYIVPLNGLHYVRLRPLIIGILIYRSILEPHRLAPRIYNERQIC